MFSDNPCSTGNRRGVNVRKQCDQSRMTVRARGGCSWYANRGRCSWRERCYPRVIVSEYLVKSNNAINTRVHRCSCRKKYTKFLGLAIDLEKRYSSKCCCCHSICGYSCVRQKSKQVRKGTCVKNNLSEDAIADLWNVKKVWNMSHSVKSPNNELYVSFEKKNVGRCREESTNIEKLVQEETTSSSYVDAKNCFVQDACIQTVCQNREETKGFSSRCMEEEKKISDLTKNTSFAFHKRCETKVEDKFEQTSLNCDCELPSVVKPTQSVDLENLPCSEEGEKLNINKCSISSTCTCVPHVPELQLEKKCNCLPAFNYKYQYVEPYKESEVETPPRLTKDQEIPSNECRRRRLFCVRNRWHSELTCPSVCKCNRYTPNSLRSSTNTESMIYPTNKTWLTRIDRDRENITFMEKPGQIGEGPWSRKETTILKKTTNPLNHEIDNRENYNIRNDCNLLTCRCGDTGVKVISDDKFEDTETSRSSTLSSSTSLSSSFYDHDRSPRSFSRYINYRCRNLASVPSSASTCTENLTSEIEYECSKESPKALNPLSLTSTVTYGNHKNGRFNITKLSCQRTLSVMQRKSPKILERTRNSCYD